VDDLRVQREIDRYVGAPHISIARSIGAAVPALHRLELEARDMPLELALLLVVESAFDLLAPRRASRRDLAVYPSTGRRYGLDQDLVPDGRRDVLPPCAPRSTT
jgi:membrane-bound lytic murein transglycosylase D